MPNFLQLFGKNLVKTLEHGSLHKKVASFGEIDTFLWFFTKCHSFCAKNLVKTLKHGILHEKVASFGEIDKFLSFLQNAKLFATFW